MVEKIRWLSALGVEASALEGVFGVRAITIRTWLCCSGMQGRNLHERFLTVPELGKCALGTVTSQLYTESFETTPAGWNNGGLGDTWAQSSARKHTGNYSYKATDVPTVSNQWLTSPQVHIPLNQSPLTLQFWNYQRLDNRAGVCYDGGLLEVSTDGGSTWTQLDSQLKSDPYDGTLVSGTGNPLAGKKAWCGNPQNWLNSIVDLNAYAGQAVSFRFSLGTDNSIGVEGWYLDDVVVQSCSLSASLGPDSIMGALPGHSVVHNFILSNMGEVDVYSLAVTGNDWPTTIISTNPITVSHGTSVTVMVQVDVPASQPTASDSFTLTATSANIPGITLVANGTTQISAIPGVSISAGQARWGNPGTQVTYVFTVTNTGNYTDTFTMAASGVWEATLPGGQTTGPVGAGKSVTVTLEVTIPNGSVGLESDVTTLSATSALGGGGIVATTTATTTVWFHNYLPTTMK
jgi:hypothetical protein